MYATFVITLQSPWVGLAAVFSHQVLLPGVFSYRDILMAQGTVVLTGFCFYKKKQITTKYTGAFRIIGNGII
jgi:hypothetical protein